MRRGDLARLDYYDVWLPELAPSAPLLAKALASPWTPAGWARFARRYGSEMGRPPAAHLIAALAALSHGADFALGCYCQDETRCHRRLLRDRLAQAGARVVW